MFKIELFRTEIEKIDFLKLNKDKFVKQILTHPHSTYITIGLYSADQTS